MLLLMLTLISIHCHRNTSLVKIDQLVGKWLVTQTDNEYIIQIGNDSMMRMYTYDIGFENKWAIQSLTNDRIILNQTIDKNTPVHNIPVSGFHMLKESDQVSVINLKYKIDGDWLTLINETTSEITKALSCKSGKCDDQKDFFKSEGVVIDLPFLKDEKGNINKYAPENGDVNILVGKPKGRYLQFHGEEFKIWSEDKFNDLKDFEFIVLKSKPEIANPNCEARLIFFMDGQAGMSLVESLITKSKAIGVQELYFSVKTDQDVSLNFQLYLRKFTTNDILINDPSVDYKSWIN
ncbi:MAG: hypothetical protein ACI8P3_002542 [Saprospiraceae bacterium]|jgi:hypothetical protein